MLKSKLLHRKQSEDQKKSTLIFKQKMRDDPFCLYFVFYLMILTSTLWQLNFSSQLPPLSAPLRATSIRARFDTSVEWSILCLFYRFLCFFPCLSAKRSKKINK